MFYLTTHSTHFIYGYMASDIWLRTILIVRKETRCRHIGYSYRLAARVLLYAPSHRQDNTYHGLCYTSRGALAGTRNSSMAGGGGGGEQKKQTKTNKQKIVNKRNNPTMNIGYRVSYTFNLKNLFLYFCFILSPLKCYAYKVSLFFSLSVSKTYVKLLLYFFIFILLQCIIV